MYMMYIIFKNIQSVFHFCTFDRCTNLYYLIV
nr:MAG TPA: hypothetical protein [Caudoviricetes sp.]